MLIPRSGLRAGPDLPPLEIEASDLAAPTGRRSERGHWTMEIVIAAAVLAAGLVVAALLLVKRAPGFAHAGTAAPAPRVVTAKEEAGKAEADDAYARRQEIGRMEERLTSREEALDSRSAELDAREQDLHARIERADEAHERHVRALERLSGLSASQAKQLLPKELEDQIR